MLLLQIVHILFQFFFLLIFIRVMGSWFPEYADTKFMQFIRFYTDPYLNLFRAIIPPLGMIDISPIVAILVLSYVIEPLVMSALKWLIF